MRPRVVAALLGALYGSLLWASPSAAQSVDQWDQGARDTERLRPRAFEELPTWVVEELERMQCFVPQAAWLGASEAPNNVVSGSFAERGQTDWAVLCSGAMTSVTVVFWGGPVHCSSPLRAPFADRSSLVGPGIVFARELLARGLDHEWILPPEVRRGPDEHDVLAEVFSESSITGYYCQDGRWLKFDNGH